MAVDKSTVRHIARLARIKVAEDDLEHLAGELSNILNFVEHLSEVDTDGVPPKKSGYAHGLPMREDDITDGGDAARVTRNAPQAEHGFFTVPKVVE